MQLDFAQDMVETTSTIAPIHPDIDNSRSLLLDAILARRSVHPKRLINPGPDAAAIQQIAESAATATDHCGLRPWRLLAITGNSRATLGEVFAKIKLQRQPEVTFAELERERDRARAVPVLLAIISRPTAGHPIVPIVEQYACMGAAIQNILLCADSLGFGAKMVSGRKVRDPRMAYALNISAEEAVFGFVCLGTTHPDAPIKTRTSIPDTLTYWK